MFSFPVQYEAIGPLSVQQRRTPSAFAAIPASRMPPCVNYRHLPALSPSIVTLSHLTFTVCKVTPQGRRSFLRATNTTKCFTTKEPLQRQCQENPLTIHNTVSGNVDRSPLHLVSTVCTAHHVRVHVPQVLCANGIFHFDKSTVLASPLAGRFCGICMQCIVIPLPRPVATQDKKKPASFLDRHGCVVPAEVRDLTPTQSTVVESQQKNRTKVSGCPRVFKDVVGGIKVQGLGYGGVESYLDQPTSFSSLPQASSSYGVGESKSESPAYASRRDPWGANMSEHLE